MATARQHLDVCFVTEEIAPITQGGIGAFVYTTLAQLSAAGMRCGVLLDTSPTVARQFTDHARSALPGVSVYTVGDLTRSEIPFGAFPYRQHGRSYRIWRTLEQLCTTTTIDLIEFPDFGGLGFVSLTAKTLGVSGFGNATLAVRTHGADEVMSEIDGAKRYHPDALQLHAMERWSLFYADVVLSSWPEVMDWYAQRYQLTRRRACAPLPYTKTGSAGAHQPPPEDQPLRILFVGKLQHLKGVDHLVTAALAVLEHQGPDALRVELVGGDTATSGHGTYGDRLRAQIPAKLRHAFTFHGALPREKVQELSNRCHLAVLPSRAETFCLAAHELCWFGIPLLVSDIPAFTSWLTDNDNALVFSDRDALTNILQRLTKKPRLLTRLTSTPVADSKQFARLYKRLVRPKKATTKNQVRETPLLSVVVPYFEMHAYVDATVESVLESSHPRWELIVVNDGSNSSAALTKLVELKRRFQGDQRFLFLDQPNSGLGNARNNGIAAAKGKYVLPLDADDLIHEEYLAKAVRALEQNHDLDFVSCFAVRFQGATPPTRMHDAILPYGLDPTLIFWENGAGTAATVFRRRLLSRYRYDETLPAYEDWALLFELAAGGTRGAVIPEPLFYYRQRSTGMARETGHGLHDILLARMLERHESTVLPTERDALKMYIEASAAQRGLGTTTQPFSFNRTPAYELLRTMYIHWLKAPLEATLGRNRSRRIVTAGRELIERLVR